MASHPMCTYVSRMLVSTWMATNTTAMIEMRRWISCWAKPGQLRSPGPTRRHQPEDHGEGEQDQGHDPAGPGGVPQRGGVHDALRLGPTAEREDLSVVANQSNCLIERPEALEGLVAPDQRRGRQGVGIDAAGAGWRTPSSSTGPSCGPWPGRRCGAPAPVPICQAPHLRARAGQAATGGWPRPGPPRRRPREESTAMPMAQPSGGGARRPPHRRRC